MQEPHDSTPSFIEAERVRVADGALVFETGDMFAPELVSIIAPGLWSRIVPMTLDDDDCDCAHDE